MVTNILEVSLDHPYVHALALTFNKLMLRCNPLGQVLLEKTKLDKVLPKLAKKGNEKTRELCQRAIEHSAGQPKEKPTSNGTPINEATNPVQLPSTSARLPETLSIRKSAKEPGDVSTKKVATASSTKSTLGATASKPSTLSNRLSSVNQTSLATGKAATKSSANSAATDTATKVKHVVPKPTPFMGLQSASKKPGTSITAQKATTTPTTDPKPT